MTTFDIVVTCKGRLAHLKQSLPLLINQLSSQIFVVDYDCPDHCGDWAKANFNISVIRQLNKVHFNASHARNIGAKAGVSPWILFIDADILLPDSFLSSIAKVLDNHSFIHGNGDVRGSFGTCVVSRQNFNQAEGYDEVIRGWGGEDNDFYNRLELLGCTKKTFNTTAFKTIQHTDESRVSFNVNKDIHYNQVRNKLYRECILDLQHINKQRPNTQIRQQIYDNAELSTSQLFSEKNHSDLYLNFKNEDVYKPESSQKIELSSTLHYHLDTTSNSWEPGQAVNCSLDVSNIIPALNHLKMRWPNCISESNEKPIFLFASIFRSGSTMLQRALIKESFIWGEPYGNTDILSHLMSPFLYFSSDWPPPQFIQSDVTKGSQLDNQWIANLYPEPKHLITATQHYLEQFLKLPASQQGLNKWGLKELRYNAFHAHFLQFIYPKASFLFLYRNPYDAYRSYREHPAFWHLRFKDLYIDTPEKFGLHWLLTTQSFLNESQQLNALILKYEDIIQPDYDWGIVNKTIGIKINLKAINKKIKNAHLGNSLSEIELNSELLRLEKIVSPLALKLGYKIDL